MAAGAAETVIEVEVAEGGIEVVAPHQADHAAAEPDAFGIAGRAVDGLRGLGEFVGLALVFLGGVGVGGGVLALVLGMGVAALGEGAAGAEQEDEPGDGEMAQDSMFLTESTRRRINSPICYLKAALAARGRIGDAEQMGPQCGEPA